MGWLFDCFMSAEFMVCKCSAVFCNEAGITNNWAASWQNQQNDLSSSEASDQHGHPPSLIRVFAVRIEKHWVPSYPLSALWRLWSDLPIWQVFNYLNPILFAGRSSSIGSVFAWHASGPEFNPHVRHILLWRLGHENISTSILPLLLIQEEQLSVTGERMYTKYW